MIRSRNAVIVSPGRVDRSPCGTGTSARLAVLHARGDIAPGQLFRHDSLIGSTFDARVEETTTVGSCPAIIPASRVDAGSPRQPARPRPVRSLPARIHPE